MVAEGDIAIAGEQFNVSSSAFKATLHSFFPRRVLLSESAGKPTESQSRSARYLQPVLHQSDALCRSAARVAFYPPLSPPERLNQPRRSLSSPD